MLIRGKISRLGIRFSAIYAVIIFLFVGCSFSGTDPKSEFVLRQIPLALQIELLHKLGLLSLFDGMSWLVGYLLLTPPVFLLLYAFGWWLEIIELPSPPAPPQMPFPESTDKSAGSDKSDHHHQE